MTLQQIIKKLNTFWSKQGCLIGQPYGLEVGAGTSNPHTFFRVLGPEPFNVAYVEPSRRPDDGRYGLSPYRFQHFFQYQIILKPAPKLNQELYLKMLNELGINQTKHDIRFVEDNWQSKPLGAWGLGWEVWCDGMEISQYTYFQQMAGVPLKLPSLEITLGLERLAMYSQGVEDYHDLMWNKTVKYSDLFAKHEYWQSKYNFIDANIKNATKRYNLYEQEVKSLLKKGNYWSAYDYILKLSHTFNILDSRGAISLADRVAKFANMGKYAKQIAQTYLTERSQLNYPLQNVPNVQVSIPTITYKQPIATTKLLPSNKITHKNQYVLEIGLEEMPANFVAKWVSQLPKNWLDKQLQTYKWTYQKAQFYFTNRRIVLSVHNPASQIIQKIIHKGPLQKVAYQNNQATPALNGWLKKHHATLKQVIIITKNGQNFVTLEQKNTVLLVEIIQKIITNLFKTVPQQKIMRWNISKNTFIRPIRWILSLYNDQIVYFKVFDLITNNVTYPPRYLKTTQVIIPTAQAYFAYLKETGVIIDHRERTKKLQKLVEQQSATHSNKLAHYLKENVYLNESINVKFITLPKIYKVLPAKVITAILEKNQRHLVVYTAHSIKFGVVSSIINPKILKGNLIATYGRLNDGLFYLKQDKDTKLADWRPKLKQINFHPKIGSFYDKVKRLKNLMSDFYDHFLGKKLPPYLITTLLLIKNDKASHLGQEYAKLEGIIGKHYALQEKYSITIANLLEDHYYPNNNHSAIPITLDAQILSLVDKLDSLTQFSWIAGLPEGSHDPYQIRQLTHQIILLLTKSEKLNIPLEKFLLYIYLASNNNTSTTILLNFINKRLYSFFKEHTTVDWLAKGIAFAKGSDFRQKWLLLQELSSLSTDQQGKIYELIKRMHNILVNDPSRQNRVWNNEFMPNKIEKKLQKWLNTVRENFTNNLKFTQLRELILLLTEYFAETMINDTNTEIKQNRLGLLKQINNQINIYLIYLPT